MPAYNAQVPPPAIFADYPNNQFLVFNAEALTTGEFSQQVDIAGHMQVGRAIAVEVTFSGAPGAFEIDVLESDFDGSGTANYYSAGVINAVGANNNARIDLNPFAGQFVVLFVKTKPANVVTCTARVTRTA